LLAQGVWNGAATQVGTQHGSGDGGTACVVTSRRMPRLSTVSWGGKMRSRGLPYAMREVF
jgi:hypothetical protein